MMKINQNIFMSLLILLATPVVAAPEPGEEAIGHDAPRAAMRKARAESDNKLNAGYHSLLALLESQSVTRGDDFVKYSVEMFKSSQQAWQDYSYSYCHFHTYLYVYPDDSRMFASGITSCLHRQNNGRIAYLEKFASKMEKTAYPPAEPDTDLSRQLYTRSNQLLDQQQARIRALLKKVGQHGDAEHQQSTRQSFDAMNQAYLVYRDNACKFEAFSLVHGKQRDEALSYRMSCMIKENEKYQRILRNIVLELEQ